MVLEPDPLSPIINLHLGWHYLYTKQYDQALEQLAKTLELDPNYALPIGTAALSTEQKQMYPEALGELATAKHLLPGNMAIRSGVGHVYAVSGDADQAEKVIADLKQESKRLCVTLYELALIYVGLHRRSGV